MVMWSEDKVRICKLRRPYLELCQSIRMSCPDSTRQWHELNMVKCTKHGGSIVLTYNFNLYWQDRISSKKANWRCWSRVWQLFLVRLVGSHLQWTRVIVWAVCIIQVLSHNYFSFNCFRVVYLFFWVLFCTSTLTPVASDLAGHCVSPISGTIIVNRAVKLRIITWGNGHCLHLLQPRFTLVPFFILYSK